MSIAKTLQELDAEIELRRRQINVLRVEISQIEDARRTTMWLEEERAARPAESQRIERVQVIVRERQEPVGQLINGTPYERKPKRKPANSFRAKVVDHLAGLNEPASTKELANHFGLKRGDEKNQAALHNALYNLKRAGVIRNIATDGKHGLYELVRPL